MSEFERWPHVVIQGGDVRLTVLLPDPVQGYYRGPRFDWSGMVALAEWKGHSFFGSWREPPHRPRANDDAAGTAEEFGMGPLTGNPPPVGYDDAAIGKVFLKIGVGRLVKVREPVYSFGARYRMARPVAWDTRLEEGSITFTQADGPLRGHAFLYRKTVAISANGSGFEILRTLANLGSTRIVQTHYCHNFLRIDDIPVGVTYSMEMPYTPVFQQASGDILGIRSKTVIFQRDPTAREGFFGLLGGYGGSSKDNCLTIKGSRAAVRIEGTESLSRFQLFGTARTISPEAFALLEVEPGATKNWASRYLFLDGEA
jgi:hypothetical protein